VPGGKGVEYKEFPAAGGEPLGSGDCPIMALASHGNGVSGAAHVAPIQRAVAIRALGWRLRVELRDAKFLRFD